jgi:hypothetical protein
MSLDRLASGFAQLCLELVAPFLALFWRQVGETPGRGGRQSRLLVSCARCIDAGALRSGLCHLVDKRRGPSGPAELDERTPGTIIPLDDIPDLAAHRRIEPVQSNTRPLQRCTILRRHRLACPVCGRRGAEGIGILLD